MFIFKNPLTRLLACFCLTSSAFAAPSIQITEPTYDFGTVSQGSMIQHDFTVTNTGTDPLLIQRTVAPCGCTAASATAEAIPPGGSSSIHVTVDTTPFSGHEQKTVTVYSNDLNNQEVTLALQGMIKAVGEAVPDRIDFGEQSAGEALSSTAKIQPASGYTFVSAKTYSKWISVSKDSKSNQLSVQVSPDAPAGELRERIVVTLKPEGNEDEVYLNLPVHARLLSPIMFKPGVLSFGVVEGDKEIVRTIQIENRSKSPLNPGAIVSDSKAVSASIIPQGNGKKYALEVRLDPKAPFEDLKALIAVNINGQELRLPVYAIRPPRV